METVNKFREMRRKRQQLPEEETRQLLYNATSGVLSLIDEDGYPYGIPLSYVLHNNKLYFHSAKNGHKIDAIRHSDKASFTAICKDEIHPETFTTYFRSVICRGHVRIINNEEEKMSALRLLAERYCLGDKQGMEAEINKSFNHMEMIAFDIEHITGKEAIELVMGRDKKQV